VGSVYITPQDLVIPARAKRSHKGDNGRVLIVGGSPEYVGASALAGIAALHSGADSVMIAAPQKVAWAINLISSDLMTHKLSGAYLKESHKTVIARLAKDADVLLFGNGAGLHDSTLKLFKHLASFNMPKVVDADAIKALSAQELSNAIVTPHKRELELFLQNSGLDPATKPEHLRQSLPFFFDKNNVLLVKGSTDVIISKKNVWYNTTGNPGMTKSGTGDVLAGLCAGFFAQLKDAPQAAVNAAFISGRSGDALLDEKQWYTYLASDVAKEVSRVMISLKD